MKHRKVQVCVIATRNNKNYLLSLQTNKKHDGFWQNVTGSVEEGESFDQAAERELLEETGIDHAKISDLNFEFKFEDRWQRSVTEKTYLARISDTIKIDLSHEHQDYKWLAIEDVREDNFKFKTNYEVFLQACKKL